jgi:hypothetical protein
MVKLWFTHNFVKLPYFVQKFLITALNLDIFPLKAHLELFPTRTPYTIFFSNFQSIYTHVRGFINTTCCYNGASATSRLHILNVDY